MRFIQCLLLVTICSFLAHGQVSTVEFGKNRVQYHDDFDQWLLYESSNFVTYWYGKARNHGIATMRLAEQDYSEVLDIIEHRINDKIEIIVYADVTDFRQSNIGLEEAFQYQEGQTKVVGNKIFVFFNGDRIDLRKQIRGGIAEVFINNMFYGSNLQEVVQNAVSAELPDWYRNGLIQFVSRQWSIDDDDALRSIFLNERNTNFKRLARFDPNLLGQSFWYYIGVRYGRSEISNLLYLTRINRNLDDAFLYVFSESLNSVLKKWKDFFTSRYAKEENQFEALSETNIIPYKTRKKIPITDVLFSPDGQSLAVVENHQGKARIFVVDMQTGKRLKVMKIGFRNNFQATDYDYPLVAWEPGGNALYILYEKRDVIFLRYIDLASGQEMEQTLPERYERVYSMACSGPNELILSALSVGMVDLYSYTPNTRQSTRLSNDIYDDLDLTISEINGQRGILFRSNRPDVLEQRTSLDTSDPFYTFNLFFLADWLGEANMIQLTSENFENFQSPLYLDNNAFAVLSDRIGIRNLKLISIGQDSVNQQIVTNYNNNILGYDFNRTTGQIAHIHKWDKKFNIYLSDINWNEFIEVELTDNLLNRNIRRPQRETPTKQTPKPAPRIEQNLSDEELIRSHTKSDDGKIYLFQSEFGEMEKANVGSQLPQVVQPVDTIEEPETSIARPDPISNLANQDDNYSLNRLKVIPYRLKFRIHSFKADLDNSLLFGGLNSFAGFREEYEQQPVGILTKLVFKDVFEDYSFEAGFRIPTTFNGAEYFVLFNDDKKRIDKQYAFYRKSTFENENSVNSALVDRTTNIITLGQVRFTYPLDIYQSVRATGTIRQDRFVFNASNRATLETPDEEDKRVGLKLEYIYDNSIDLDLNLRHGVRAIVFAEAVKKFDLSFDPWDISFNKGFMTVLGVDLRAYYNFISHSIIAFRFAGATSFGSEKILHHLGGVDNQVNYRFDNSIPQSNDPDIAYRAIAPNLRGFDYNIRNGANYMLLNSELRIPIFKFINPNIRFGLLRHLQLVGFVDAGLAWDGDSPFADNNPINLATLTNPPTVKVTVNYYRDPIVVGYGVGVRTMLFGYFIRADYGWGLETRQVLDPKLHIGLGIDF